MGGFLIDGLKALLRWDWFSSEEWARLRSLGDVVMRVTPATGEVVWQTPAWEQQRTDVFQVQVRVSGSGLAIWGSPARCFGDGDAVFGSGASAACDLLGCVWAMVEVVERSLGVELSRDPADYSVSRVDVTQNLLVASAAQGREVLAYLRGTSGGRYRVSAAYTESVYWSTKSTLRAAKAYLKGPHLRYLMRQSKYSGRVYTEEEIQCADRLVRCELELRRHHWQRLGKPWWQVTASELLEEWEAMFGRMVGEAEVTEAGLRERILSVASTESRGRAAWACWSLISAMGWEAARDSYPRASWYRHLSVLRAAGLRDVSLSHGRVIPLRRSVELRPVASWDEFSKAA